jgi:hypothetical protein
MIPSTPKRKSDIFMSTPVDSIQTIKVPQPVPVTTTRFRPPKKNIPQTKPERDQFLQAIRDYVEAENPVPPMPIEELDEHAKKILAKLNYEGDDTYLHYTAVCLNNEMWRETLAEIPYERRLLLMPKCLRVEDKCPAPLMSSVFSANSADFARFRIFKTRLRGSDTLFWLPKAPRS